MRQIYLTEPWEKAFDEGNIIIVNYENLSKEMKILNTYSYFGEYIDLIKLEDIETNEIISISLKETNSYSFFEKN